MDRALADPAPFPSEDGAGAPLIDAENVAPAAATAPRSRLAGLVLGASLMLIALNLRVLFTSLSALLPEVMRDTAAPPAMASLLTTVPVFCLGLFSPPAAGLARRYGTERVILAALLAIAGGTALRGLATLPTLLAGGLLAGAGIAFGNVLLPGLVKRDFPDRIAAMTGLYSMALSGGSAIAAGLTVPIAHAARSWPFGLGVWALPAVAVALVWLPQVFARRAPPAAGSSGAARVRVALWGQGLAWQVSLFMGLQSALAYCVFGWLVPILRDRGFDPVAAGVVLSISVTGQMIGCLVAPALATLGRDQRGPSLVCYALALAGILGCFYAPVGWVWGPASLLGLAQGGLLAIALTIILLRAPDAATAARLSGMAQGVGYTLAAGGPLLLGVLRQAAGGFSTAPLLFAAIIGLGALSGLGAGRAVTLK